MNSKYLILLTAVVAMFGRQVLAQIHIPDSLRIVNGQLYNINQSALWTTLQGDILNVSTKGVILSLYRMEPIYEAATTSREVDNYMGGIAGYRQVATQVYVGDKKVPYRKIILRNYPANLQPAVSQEISFRAMQIGTSDYNGETLELWDYGSTPTQDELRKFKDEADEQQRAAKKELDKQRYIAAEKAAAANKAAQAKVVIRYQEQADKGDPYGLLRMGEFYRDGNGVPKDLDKAREYLAKASAAGSPDAADELSKLNQVSTNAPANP